MAGKLLPGEKYYRRGVNGVQRLLLGGCMKFSDLKAGLGQTVTEISSIPAKVIELAEMVCPSFGARDATVFEGLKAVTVQGNSNQGHTSGRQNAVNLANGGGIVFDVFEHMVAHHHVEGVVTNSHVGNVGMDVSLGIRKIGGEVKCGPREKGRQEIFR